MEVTYQGNYQKGIIEKFREWVKSINGAKEIYDDKENGDVIIIYSTQLCDLSIKFALKKNKNRYSNSLKIHITGANETVYDICKKLEETFTGLEKAIEKGR